MSTRRLTPQGFTEKTRELDNRNDGEVKWWRKKFADICNKHLERAGLDKRVDHRSHADRGLGIEPSLHEGKIVTNARRNHIYLDRACENEAIYLRNEAKMQVIEETLAGYAFAFTRNHPNPADELFRYIQRQAKKDGEQNVLYPAIIGEMAEHYQQYFRDAVTKARIKRAEQVKLLEQAEQLAIAKQKQEAEALALIAQQKQQEELIKGPTPVEILTEKINADFAALYAKESLSINLSKDFIGYSRDDYFLAIGPIFESTVAISMRKDAYDLSFAFKQKTNELKEYFYPDANCTKKIMSECSPLLAEILIFDDRMLSYIINRSLLDDDTKAEARELQQLVKGCIAIVKDQIIEHELVKIKTIAMTKDEYQSEHQTIDYESKPIADRRNNNDDNSPSPF